MHGELVESLLEIFQLQMDKNVQPPNLEVSSAISRSWPR